MLHNTKYFYFVTQLSLLFTSRFFSECIFERLNEMSGINIFNLITKLLGFKYEYTWEIIGIFYRYIILYLFLSFWFEDNSKIVLRGYSRSVLENCP